MINDISNMPPANPKSASKILVANSSQRVEKTDLKNFFCGKFVKPIKFAPRMRLSVLGYLVPHVVPMIAEEEVVRINTESVVTAMQYEDPFWDGSVVEFPREAMSLTTVVVGEGERAVASISAARCPQPTLVPIFRNVDLGPEPRLPVFHAASVAQRRAQC